MYCSEVFLDCPMVRHKYSSLSWFLTSVCRFELHHELQCYVRLSSYEHRDCTGAFAWGLRRRWACKSIKQAFWHCLWRVEFKQALILVLQIHQRRIWWHPPSHTDIVWVVMLGQNGWGIWSKLTKFYVPNYSGGLNMMRHFDKKFSTAGGYI